MRNYSEKDAVSNIPAAIDANGNVYVTGYTYNYANNYDYTTIKYNQLGDTLWVRHYNGPANSSDLASAIALDNAGYVYITGSSVGVGIGRDYATLKYDQNGNQLWVVRYNGTGNSTDDASSVAVDASGNVYVTGSSMGGASSEDFVTVKYNSSGVQQWVNRYNGTGNGFDAGVGIVVSSTGRLFATGTATVTGGQKKILSIRYNPMNGNTFWTKVYNGTFNGNDVSNDLISDGNNLFICGSYESTGNINNYFLIKYNGNGGTTAFVKTYDAYGMNNVATSLAFDNTGNIVVTGESQNTGNKWECHTLKYNPTGTQVWLAKYNSQMPFSKKSKLVVDPYNMIYVCGTMYNGSNTDFLLLQYSATGNQVWYKTYNGNANGPDAATDMVVDNMGRIFVTGETFNGNAKLDYTTIKYSQSFVYHPPDFNNEIAPSSFLFYENKGQLINTNGNLIPDIKYYTNASYPALYFSKTGLSYVFSRIDTSIVTPDTLHRIDMELLKCNALAETFPVDTGQGYLNYFLGHCPQGVTNVKGYKRLFIPNIYPNIDLHYYANDMGLKYYFVIKPGGNMKDINLRYNGAQATSIDGTGNLHVKSSIGEVVMEKPSVYQVDLLQNIIPVGFTADWVSGGGNMVHFNTGVYNTSLPLVVQVDGGHGAFSPNANGNLEHSTYYGGSGWDEFKDIATDGTGNQYITGLSSSIDFPVTNGSTNTNTTVFDAIVVKLFANVGIDWATYFGGSDKDEGNAIDVDSYGNVFFTGSTTSANFPLFTPSGAYSDNSNTSMGMPRDIFIVKLSNTGIAIWSTFYGGTEASDIGNDLVIDASNNVYIVGEKDETTSLYNQSGAYNSSTGTGIILKFNNQGVRLWATAFGTDPACSIKSATIDYQDKLVITGTVGTSGFTMTDPVSAFQQSTLRGTRDAFIAKFNTNNALYWSTLFGGDGTENGQGVSTDNSGNIYITGGTSSSTNFPYLNGGGYFVGSHQGQGSSGSFIGDAYIAKFNSSGSQITSTYYGGSAGEWGLNIAIDNSNRVFVTGTTTSASFPLLPSNPANTFTQSALSNTNNTQGDAFIISFDQNMNRLWTTYFGGGSGSLGLDIGYGIATYQNSKLYLVGATSSSSNFPLEDIGGSHFVTSLHGFVDGFYSRFDLNAVVGVDETNKPISNCSVLTYPNPSDGNFIIGFNLTSKSKVHLQVFDIKGQKVKDERYPEMYSNQNIQLDLSSFAKGVYVLQMSFGEYSVNKKIIIY